MILNFKTPDININIYVYYTGKFDLIKRKRENSICNYVIELTVSRVTQTNLKRRISVSFDLELTDEIHPRNVLSPCV